MLADDRFCDTDADRHEDISRNGSSGFGGSADSATADLSPCPINAQIAASLDGAGRPVSWRVGPARFGSYRKPMGGVGVLPYLPPSSVRRFWPRKL